MKKEEYKTLAKIIPDPEDSRGTPRKVERWQVLAAIRYKHLRNIPWHNIPSSYPNFKTVHWYYVHWREESWWPAVSKGLGINELETRGR